MINLRKLQDDILMINRCLLDEDDRQALYLMGKLTTYIDNAVIEEEETRRKNISALPTK